MNKLFDIPLCLKLRYLNLISEKFYIFIALKMIFNEFI